MLQIFVVTVFFVLAFSLMAMALHFAKWKKKASGCCGGGNCDTDGGGSHSCYRSKLDFVNEHAIKQKAN
ncbi:MAG: hypothetical protein K9J12_13810 [Melioribacteraceae bacterium]|nr:hypothetical protein [Melioribacteraceae bacterium]MCF8263160.1 hypothetical protein [Melioribacteraceae bacterium]MCF8413284.1 hypothetical protein [Melioribacteraceae bacterium]MCF8430390.1 hypothetical protein [Melioribacteraceae bacterium]